MSLIWRDYFRIDSVRGNNIKLASCPPQNTHKPLVSSASCSVFVIARSYSLLLWSYSAFRNRIFYISLTFTEFIERSHLTCFFSSVLCYPSPNFRINALLYKLSHAIRIRTGYNSHSSQTGYYLPYFLS